MAEDAGLNWSGLVFTQRLTLSQTTMGALVIALTVAGLYLLRRRCQTLPLPDRDVRRRRLVLRLVMVVAAEVLLLLALARPELGQKEETIVRQGLDIMVLVDVSRSMLAEDVVPSRLEAAKRKVLDLTQVMSGERLALVPFSGTAFVQCPLTSDYDAVRLFLDLLTPELLPRGGSNIGQALSIALNSIKETPDEKRRGSAILVFSDGEDLSGGLETAVGEAVKLGVRVFAIGLGTELGAPIPLVDGGFQKDLDGKMVVTRRESKALEQMAAKTGGAYWSWSLDGNDIDRFSKAMAEGGGAQVGEEKRMVGQPAFQYFVAAAFLLLFAEGSMLTFPLVRRGFRRGLAAIFLGILLAPTNAAVASSIKAQEAFDQKAYEDAARLYGEEAKQKSGDEAARLHYNRGVAAFQAGRFEEAEKAFEQAGQGQDPKLKSHSFYNQGTAAAKQGRLDAAIEAFKQALSFDPDDKAAKENFSALQKAKEEKQKEPQPQKPQPSDKDDEKPEDKENQQGSEPDKKEEKTAGESKEQSQKQPGQDSNDPQSKSATEGTKSPQQAQAEAAAKEASKQKPKKLRSQQIERILEGISDRGQAKWYAPNETETNGSQEIQVEKDW